MQISQKKNKLKFTIYLNLFSQFSLFQRSVSLQYALQGSNASFMPLVAAFLLKLTHCFIYWSHSYTAVSKWHDKFGFLNTLDRVLLNLGRWPSLVHTRQAPTSRTRLSESQKWHCQEFRSVFSFFYGKWQHRGASSSWWHLWLQKKASGPLDVYWKTALSDDLCKHFLNEFMGPLTYFWSYSILSKHHK